MANISNRHFISLPSPPRTLPPSTTPVDANVLLEYVKDLHRDLENIISAFSKATSDIDGGGP